MSPRILTATSNKHFLRTAADLIVDNMRQALAVRGRCVAAIAGGETPKPLYRLLASPPFSIALPWPHIHWFPTDERCVPPDHPLSNHRLLHDNLFPLGRRLKHTLHRVPGELGPEQAAADMENDLRALHPGVALPVLDLILLGIGTDGHTASLFPGREIDGGLVLPVPAPEHEPRVDRVSLSLSVINAARCVVFIVSGKAKAEIVARILTEQQDSRMLPAARVAPKDGALWLLNPEAGALLES